MKKITYAKTFAFLALSAAALCFAGCNNTLADEFQVQPSDWSEGVMKTSAYVMVGTGTSETLASDGLHLAYSENGLTWTVLNDNEKTFSSTLGSRHIRDPYIFRMNDGTFVLLAADFTNDGQYTDWGAGESTDYGDNPSNRIYVAFSEDLVSWNYEHFLTVKSSAGTYGVRYPKAIYNKTNKCYDIYFAGDDGDGVQRIYYVQTCDFLTLKNSDEGILFSPAHSVSCPYLVKDSGNYYLFAYDARAPFETKIGRDIQLARSSNYLGEDFSFLATSASISGKAEDFYVNRVDGQTTMAYENEPCVYKLSDGTWVMLTNQVSSKGSYSAYVTDDIDDPESWEESSSITKFSGTDMTVGTSVLEVTAEELEVLLSASW